MGPYCTSLFLKLQDSTIRFNRLCEGFYMDIEDQESRILDQFKYPKKDLHEPEPY